MSDTKNVAVDAGSPRNAPASHMQGFLSRDGMPPAALLEAGRAEVAGYGVDVIEGRADHIDHIDDIDHIEHGFQVHLAGGPVLPARRVVVATGLRDELPDIPGVREAVGQGRTALPVLPRLRGR
ncbi:hypothetical protein ACQP1V_19460 [Microtetraspora malaysiensis]|uniref:hypothetical protein n=1 Tax=Microtetraspora malaysiensis TaxID=161358 RepID=UPI003D9137B4